MSKKLRLDLASRIAIPSAMSWKLGSSKSKCPVYVQYLAHRYWQRERTAKRTASAPARRLPSRPVQRHPDHPTANPRSRLDCSRFAYSQVRTCRRGTMQTDVFGGQVADCHCRQDCHCQKLSRNSSNSSRRAGSRQAIAMHARACSASARGGSHTSCSSLTRTRSSSMRSAAKSPHPIGCTRRICTCSPVVLGVCGC